MNFECCRKLGMFYPSKWRFSFLQILSSVKLFTVNFSRYIKEKLSEELSAGHFGLKPENCTRVLVNIKRDKPLNRSQTSCFREQWRYHASHFLRHYLLMILMFREITSCSINKLWFLGSLIIFTNISIPHKPCMFLTRLWSWQHGIYVTCFSYSTFKSTLFLKYSGRCAQQVL
jgi:hypothetical protein